MKISGFQTERPLVWLTALETLIRQHQIPCASFNNPDLNGIFIETQIFLYEKGNNILAIHIYHSTGILLFKGPAYKSWIEKYMNELCNNVNNYATKNITFFIIITSLPQASRIYNKCTLVEQSRGVNKK